MDTLGRALLRELEAGDAAAREENLPLTADLLRFGVGGFPDSPGSARTRASPPEAPSAHATGERSGSLTEELEVAV